MATFVLIHGGGHGAWCWHRLEPELRARGHGTVTMDLPSPDPAAGLAAYVDTVLGALADHHDLVVVGHSLGGLVAPVVCERVPARLLVLLAAMVPAPGETAQELWAATRFLEEMAAHGDTTGDPIAAFYHDVEPALAADAVEHLREQALTPMLEPNPLTSWPDVPTRYLSCREDRMVVPAWVRAVVPDRLGIEPDEIDGSHSPFLSRPGELADRLVGYVDAIG